MTVENLGSARIVADIWRDTVRQKDARIAELEAALREISSQCHNLPRTATADHINVLAQEALAK